MAYRLAPRSAAADALRHPVIGRFWCLTFVSGFAFQGIEAIFALWTEARHAWGPREIGIAFAIVGIASPVSQLLFAGPLARRLGRAWPWARAWC